MTTPVSYTPLSPPWHNEPIEDSPLSAARFGPMDLGIKANSNRVDSLCFNVQDFASGTPVGDGIRLFGAVASSASATVTVSGASFTTGDIGKIAIVYTASTAGTITTIQTVNSATSITLAANAGITTTSGTGYLIYGTDNSTIIQNTLNAAAAYTATTNTTDPNNPIGMGRALVLLPNTSPQSLYLIASALTIPSAVAFNGLGTIANVMASRNAFCVQVSAFAVVQRLEIENLFGTGVNCGTIGLQAHIYINDLRVWHCTGASSAPSGLGVVGSTSGGTLAAGTRYYVVTAIDAQGGETLVSNEVSVVNTGTTSSNTLTWTAFSGASSYRIYRGTATGAQSVYFTSATNSFTDIGGSSTSGYPTGPGVGLRLNGYHYEINTLWIKIARLGVYHSAGSDCNVNCCYIVGGVTGVRCNATNQLHYNNLFLDTCGGTGSLGGLVLDNGCSNSSFNVQAFVVVGISTSLTPVVNIGPFTTSPTNVDLHIHLMAASTGGTGVSLANCSNILIDQLLTNVGFSSSGGANITTGVAYGSGLGGVMLVRSVLFAAIAPHSGSISGVHTYLRNSTWYTAQAGSTTVAALTAAGTSAPTPTTTNANDQRGAVSMGTGTGPTTGAQASVTFTSGAYITAPTVLIIPANAATAALQPYVTSVSTTGFSIAFGVVPTASQSVGTYQVNYLTQG